MMTMMATMAWNARSASFSLRIEQLRSLLIPRRKSQDGKQPMPSLIFHIANSDSESRLEVLRALVGHIPPHPLWAELLWQRQEDISARMTAAQQPITQTSTVEYSTHLHPR